MTGILPVLTLISNPDAVVAANPPALWTIISLLAAMLIYAVDIIDAYRARGRPCREAVNKNCGEERTFRAG